MFSKRKDGEGAAKSRAGDEPDVEGMAGSPLKPFSRKGSHAPSPPRTAGTFQPDVPRRVADIPGIPRRVERGPLGDTDAKRLVVGRDISLNGEITSCDKLVVEGRVEVTLSNARSIEVTPTGFFRGTADVEEADISGRYEGELTAREKLTVRAGGQISGSIRYGRIVIESGGEILGDMQTLEQAADIPADEGASASNRSAD